MGLQLAIDDIERLTERTARNLPPPQQQPSRTTSPPSGCIGSITIATPSPFLNRASSASPTFTMSWSIVPPHLTEPELRSRLRLRAGLPGRADQPLAVLPCHDRLGGGAVGHGEGDCHRLVEPAELVGFLGGQLAGGDAADP
jgi:hypothetical protein